MKNSPFPGMDPFIEGYGWASFHLNFIANAMRNLAPRLPERYTIAAEMGIIAKDLLKGEDRFYRPDISIAEAPAEPSYTTTDVAAINAPTVYASLSNTRQRTLTIRTVDEAELVTAVEVLSPVNKQGTGLAAYRRKRQELIRNEVNLVEIDLLRGGTPPFLAEDWPRGTYRIQAVEAIPDMVGFWAVGLDEVLPTIGVPLLSQDGILPLDLQAVFTDVYRFGLYDRSLQYAIGKLKPSPTAEELPIIERYLS